MSDTSSGPRTLEVSLGSRSYPIHIGPGLLGQPDALAPWLAGRQVMIVTNEVVAPLYLERCRASLPAGVEVRAII